MLVSNVREAGRKVFRKSQSLRLIRNKCSYEGDGKTTVKILNQDPDLGLLIDGYSNFGFRLNNGITILGPMAIFPRTILSWQIQNSDDITEPSLRLFKLIVPKIDLLVIGLETKDRKAFDSVFKVSRQAQLNVEILPTEHAVSTFNFLNAEGRSIAGAMIPPLHVDNINEDDMRHSALQYNDPYKRDYTAY